MWRKLIISLLYFVGMQKVSAFSSPKRQQQRQSQRQRTRHLGKEIRGVGIGTFLALSNNSNKGIPSSRVDNERSPSTSPSTTASRINENGNNILSIIDEKQPAKKVLVERTKEEQKLYAAVVVPGFLMGAKDFQELCNILTSKGLPTVAVPMPNWHWLSCLGGRSARPILERIDFTVRHLIANDGDTTKIPSYDYSVWDAVQDFLNNPGGIMEVGGSSIVQEYPHVDPCGHFPLPPRTSLFTGNNDDDIQKNNNDDTEQKQIPKKIILIGHSAGGWISRVYLSHRNYGGKVYDGSRYVHSLVTLGTPHAAALGPAFEGIKWINDEGETTPQVKKLCVAGRGFKGDEWGGLTQGAYTFCCPNGSDGTSYDGDGMTPVFSSLSMEGSDHMILDGVTHIGWSDMFGGELAAPELAKDYKNGRPWYGTDHIVDKWLEWILGNYS